MTRKDMQEGTAKYRLTGWWLHEVQDKVDEFLQEEGYLDVNIPHDYYNTPPSDLSAVRSNLEVVRRVLKNQEMMMRPVIEALKEEIYPVIDAFNRGLYVQLTYLLHLDTICHSPAALAEMTTSDEDVMARISLLGEEEAEWVQSVIEDLGLLTEMKAIEDPTYKEGQQSFHIVPVSGLAISRLARLEIELRTVLEVWDSSTKKGRAHFRKRFDALQELLIKGKQKEAETLSEEWMM